MWSLDSLKVMYSNNTAAKRAAKHQCISWPSKVLVDTDVARLLAQRPVPARETGLQGAYGLWVGGCCNIWVTWVAGQHPPSQVHKGSLRRTVAGSLALGEARHVNFDFINCRALPVPSPPILNIWSMEWGSWIVCQRHNRCQVSG